MIAWESSLEPVAAHQAPWDVWLFNSETHVFWKLSSTVCLRVCAPMPQERNTTISNLSLKLHWIISHWITFFFFFNYCLTGKQIVTPSRLFADNGLCCVRCDGRSWLSFHNTLNTCSAFVCNDFGPFRFVSCTMQCTDEGVRWGCNCWLIDWSFWILLLACLGCPEVTFN
jgi:hypothetical protein